MNLICFGFDPWNDMWKRNQIMVYLLSRLSWIEKVLFLNPDVWLASDLPYLLSDKGVRVSKNATWRGIVPYKPVPNITVWSPTYLPKLSSLTRRFFDHLLSSVTRRPYILLINRATFSRQELYRVLVENAALSVFDWSDDFVEFLPSTMHNERKELGKAVDRLLQDVDIVFCINEFLAEKARRYNRGTHIIKNASAMDISDLPSSVPLKKRPNWLQRHRGRRIIGYVGWIIPRRLDADLIHAVASMRPEWDFVFVGPKTVRDPLELSARPQRSNIYVYDAVPYANLHEVIQAFDVCIIPNRVNEYTRGNDPIKIFDYMYLRKPIVSTPTSGTEPLSGVIGIAGTAKEFISKIEEGLTMKREFNSVYANAVEGNVWRMRIREVEHILLQGLAGKRHRAKTN